MTPEESKKTFKVGDRIRLLHWDSCEFLTILFIGKKFTCETPDGEEYLYDSDDDWIKINSKIIPSKEINALIGSRIIGFTPEQSELAHALIAMIRENNDVILKWLDQNWEKK